MSGNKYKGYEVRYAVDTHALRNSVGGDRPCSLDKTLTFYNESSSQVVIKDRFGVTSIVPPKAQLPKPNEKLMFQLQWYLNAVSLKYTIEDLEQRYPNPSTLIQVMLHSFTDALARSRGTQLIATIPVWVDVPMSELRSAGGRLYIEELDMTVALLEDDNKKIEHPMSTNQRARDTISTFAPKLGKDTLFFMIKAVDNTPCKSREDRYIWIGDDCYHIPIEYDPTLQDGITVASHASSTRKNKMGVLSSSMETRLMSFEEADELLGLSTTVEGARFRGNSKDSLSEKITAMKLRETELTSQLLDEKNLREDIKHTRELEKLAQERVREEMKHARELEKAEADKQKIELERIREEARHLREVEKAVQDKHRLELERQRDEFKHTREMEKAEYERKLNETKYQREVEREDARGFVEWLRIGGGVITAGLAFASLVQKIKPI